MAYRIQFAKSAEDHLDGLTVRQQAIVLSAVRAHLEHEPFRETRNRKKLRPNPLAPWELRIGVLRLFYEENSPGSNLVNVLAIGLKRENRLFIAGQEIRI